MVASLKGPPVGFLAALLVVWVGLPLLLQGASFELGTEHRLILTAMVVLGAAVVWLVRRKDAPLRRRLAGLLGGLIVAGLLALLFLVTTDLSYRQIERPLQSQTAPEITWTVEAEARLQNVPSFLRGMVRRATEAYAINNGYTLITPDVMTEAREKMGM